MKETILCALLLTTVTLVAGEGGTITVFNGGTFRLEVDLEYTGEYGVVQKNILGQPFINAGASKTIPIQEGAANVYFKLFSTPPGSDNATTVIDFRTSKPVRLCFKIWGTIDRPQVDQTACDATAAPVVWSGDGGAVTVTNDATYPSQINLDYKLRDWRDTHSLYEDPEIKPGDTKTVAIPAGASEIGLNLLHPKGNAFELFNASLSTPVKLCLRIWGGVDDPQSGQVDC